MAQRIRRPLAVGRSGFWPRQRGVYWGPGFESAPLQHERYAVVPSDEHNIRADSTAAVFMTSRNEDWRSRWQVPRAGGWAITGDIDTCGYDEFDHRGRPSPSELNRQEMAEVARGIEQVLKLSSAGVGPGRERGRMPPNGRKRLNHAVLSEVCYEVATFAITQNRADQDMPRDATGKILRRDPRAPSSSVNGVGGSGSAHR